MISRRSFSQLCGVSALSLCSGLEASESTTVQKTRTIALDNDLFKTDLNRFFTTSSEQIFHLDSRSSIYVPMYMCHQTISYKKEYADRLSFVNRVKQILIDGIKTKIEIDLISVLLTAGAEKCISEKSQIQFGSKLFDYIASTEAVESNLMRYIDSGNVEMTQYLGRVGQGRQEHFEKIHNMKCRGDLAIRLKSKTEDSRFLITLPTLPPLMGFDTQFEFQANKNKVTEIGRAHV